MSGSDDLEGKIESFEKQGIHQIKVAVTDVDGVLRGKYISTKKLRSIARGTSGFCDCIFGWDVNDTLYDNSKFTGWHTAYPDALYKIDFSTERKIPGDGTPLFLADFVQDDGTAEHPVCPRNLLKRVLARASERGIHVNLAFEYEFFVFDETPHSVREKGFKNLRPLTPGMFGYSMIRNSTHSELFEEFMDYFREFEIPLEGLHCETGPGVWEAAIEYDEALKSADKASLFKSFAKVFFQRRDLIATFMARWSLKYPGQSGHIHQSLFDKKSGKSLFYDEKDPHSMSETMKQYIAGQAKYMKSFLALSSPTINSYTRLVKGFWAPTAATWGVENRTAALRVIPGNESSQRVEFRVGSADANPYVSAAAVIAAGLLGIEEKLSPEAPVKGSAYEIQNELPESMQLSSNLLESTRALENCPEAKEILGADFVDHFVGSRKWELREHEKAVTDWQLERYFEII